MASDRCRKKFVGTKYEQELNDLYKNDLISTTSTPTEAFNASPLFQLEGWERDKFNNHFYAWRTRILQKEEEQRTKGRNPPTDALQGVAGTERVPRSEASDQAGKENVKADSNAPKNETDNSTDGSSGRVVQDFTFSPPIIKGILKYQGGKKIIVVCVWLPSGVDSKNIEVRISPDNKHLEISIPMEKHMGNGLVVHGDLVPRGPSVTKKERMQHVRVDHWDTLIKDTVTESGTLPSFNASLALPDVVLRNTILREFVLETPNGAKYLVMDLLVEEPKKPSASTSRPTYKVDVDDAANIQGSCT